ncbi:MAG: hypothetical protein ACRBFS_02105 [Aureispira sp.]
MQNLRSSTLIGFVTLFIGMFLFFSCQKENLESEVEAVEVVSTKAGGGGGGGTGTSCTVSCFWGSATANCPSGGASCSCSYGSPVTSCGGGSSVAGSFNQSAIRDFANFVTQNNLDPILVNKVHQLHNAFNSRKWSNYVQAHKDYVNTITAQSKRDQASIDKWISSQQ